MSNKTGIYRILNTTNGDSYVGSSVDVPRRWLAHKNLLRSHKHSNCHLQRAWDKYGSEYFVFEVIEFVDRNQLIDREQFYIDSENPQYNLSMLAGRVDMTTERKTLLSEKRKEWYKSNESPFKGKKHTEESRRKISENHADVTGANNPFFGKHVSEENRQKLQDRVGNKHHFFGTKRPEHAKKVSGSNNYFFGKSHTENTKLKLSASHTKFSESDLLDILKLIEAGMTYKEIAVIFYSSPAAICRLVNNKIKCIQMKGDNV